MRANFSHFQPFLSDADADQMISIAESYGSFGTYATEATSTGLGESLPQRFDAALNYIERGLDGSGNSDEVQVASARTNYFRETYAYCSPEQDDLQASGIAALLNHPRLTEGAREIFDRPIIVPAIVYANILIPGQELAIHTDVPEFRGANRKLLPQWLLVVMHHSGLFEQWRIPIATCVSWFGVNKGGAFAFFPSGIAAERESIDASHNTAVLMDTDSIFHGVERVATTVPDLPAIDSDTKLYFVGNDEWELRHADDDNVLERYLWSDLRYSISWKAYCFKNDAEQQLWRDGSDQLELEFILDRLEQELRAQGVMQNKRLEPTEFAKLLVKTFVKFPAA